MKFSLQLSKRDKTLLSVTGAVIVAIVLGMLVNVPLQMTVADLWTQFRSNEKRIAQMEEKETKLPEIQAANLDKRIYFDELQDNFLPMMHSQDVDRMLTGTAVSYGLNVTELHIIMPEEPEMVGAYGESRDRRNEADWQEGVYVVTVEMKVLGSEAETEHFVDDIAGKVPMIRLISFNTIREMPGGDGKYDAQHATVFQIECYLCCGVEEQVQ